MPPRQKLSVPPRNPDALRRDLSNNASTQSLTPLRSALLFRFGVIATRSEQRRLSQFLHPPQIAQPQSLRRSVMCRCQELSPHTYGKVLTTEKRSAYKYCRR